MANPVGTYGMNLSALLDAPCPTVALDGDAVIAECRLTMGNHQRAKGIAAGRMLHESADARWYVDDNGDTHIYVRPGAACELKEDK